jgi:hypothetical protein
LDWLVLRNHATYLLIDVISEKLTGLVRLRMTALSQGRFVTTAAGVSPQPAPPPDEERLLTVLRKIKRPESFEVWIDWAPTKELVRHAPFRLGLVEWDGVKESITWLNRA